MNCCDYDCQQGKTCPVRRVRAGTCANTQDVELWTRHDMDALLKKAAKEQDRSDRIAAVFIATCVFSFFLLVWLTS